MGTLMIVILASVFLGFMVCVALESVFDFSYCVPVFLCITCTGTVLGIAWMCYAQSRVTADSTAVGVVVDYGTEGAIWQTNEGTLGLGFTKSGTGTFNWGCVSFCAQDPEIDTQIREARNAGTPIRLYYRQYWWMPAWRCWSDRVAYRVEAFQ